MGMFDYIKIHKKWFDGLGLENDPKNPNKPQSFLDECYLTEDGEFYRSFQTKDLDNTLDEYEIDMSGLLFRNSKQEWDDQIEHIFLGEKMKGGLKTIKIHEHQTKFFGTIEVHHSLWGSGKEGSGRWPSDVYEDLGHCSLTFDIVDGVVFRLKEISLKEPVLRVKDIKEYIKK